jgi:hypothetical protein
VKTANRPQRNTNNKSVTNEFSSFRSTRSYTYYGFDSLDLYKAETLAKLAKDPMNNNQLLRELSKALYSTNGTYTHTVDYMVAMPTLDRVIIPHGKSVKKKRKNEELMDSVLRMIKDKEIIRDALFKGMVNGVAFYYFETSERPVDRAKLLTDYDVQSITEINEVNALGINAEIISLPTDYTRIIGIKNSSYVIAFDLDYFDLADGEPVEKKLLKYPKEIREAYKNRKDGSSTGGNWLKLDNTKTIVHKIRSERNEPYGRPLVLAAINDILYNDYFTQTKRNILDDINNKVIYQTFPEGKEKGTSALTKKQQEEQHAAVRGAVMTKNNRGGVSFFSVAAGTKLNTIDSANTDIFDEKYENKLNDKIALGLGIAGSLLNGVGSGSYSAQMQNLELIKGQVFQWVDQITEELNKVIGANIIKDKANWMEVYYLRTTYVDKDKAVEQAKELYLQGKGSLSLWVASCGIRPDAFFALLDKELEDSIETKYPVHQTSFTLSKDKDSKSGRPTTDNPADATVIGRNNNGNALPSPSDN